MSLIDRMPRPTRLIPFVLAIFLLSGSALLTSAPAAIAQDAGTNGRPTKEAQALLDMLDDIDTLRVLTPLNFTPDQIDKLVDAITSAKADYDKKVTALASEPVLKMADEIRDLHKQAFNGKLTTKEFDNRVRKLQSTFLAQRDELNRQNILRLSDATGKIFTDKQRAAVVKMEKDTLANLGVSQTSTPESKLLNAYIVDIFINTPRIVPILKELKTAIEAK